MISLSSALRPRWIFDILRLWKPHQSLPILQEQAMHITVQELASAQARVRAIAQMLRIFVPTSGRGAYRRTLAQNMWAVYARSYQTTVLAPAFLTRLTAGVEMGEAIGAYFSSSLQPGFAFSSKDVRAFLDEQTSPYSPAIYPSRGVGVWLRTLAHFQVLIPGAHVGDYTVRRALPVAAGMFPLLVYSWFDRRQIACVEPRAFAQDPLLAYVDRAGFDYYWRLYAGHLWYAEMHDAQVHWRLRYTAPADIERALINLPGTYRRPRRYAKPKAHARQHSATRD